MNLNKTSYTVSNVSGDFTLDHIRLSEEDDNVVLLDIGDFARWVRDGSMHPDDGEGLLAIGEKVSSISVWDKDLTKEIIYQFTHVLWIPK